MPGNAVWTFGMRPVARQPRLLGRIQSRDVVPAAALCLFVAVLGVLPYAEFARDRGSIQAFKSAYDEDTYLLNDLWSPDRVSSRTASSRSFVL